MLSPACSAGDIELVGGTIERNAERRATTGIGTISAIALTGKIAMVNGTVYSTGSGTITMTAATDIELATVATTGDVTLTATGSAVVDVLTGETANITGKVVTITAGTGIGTSDGGTTIEASTSRRPSSTSRAIPAVSMSTASAPCSWAMPPAA